MAAFAEPEIRLAQPPGWFDQLVALLTRELAPSSRRLRTSLRMTTIATVGAGLIVSCHVNNELGTYIVWLLVGAGPMMSLRKAVAFLMAEAFALSTAVLMAGILVESPWLLLPFVFAMTSLSTYVGTTFKLGAPILLIQVVCLDTFYNVVFAPDQIGWAAAGIFGGSVIAFGTIVLFDNWLWPDPAEEILLESLAASVARDRARLLEASNFYLDGRGAPRPPIPPPTSDLPLHMDLLNRAAAEGVPEHRLAILLAAVTRVARIGLEIERLIFATLQNVPREVRDLVRPEIQATVDAIAVVLDEDSHELPTHIEVGPDQTPPASRTRARSALDALSARILQVRPTYIRTASSAELENFADFTDSLAALTGHIEHLLDEPPPPVAGAISASPRLNAPDPAIVRYSLKVGVCVVIGYVVGLVDHRPELNTILTTVIITALPTYGAALRKMNLRIIGAAIGGLISLLTIIIVTPNFTSLPAYLITVSIVFYMSAYSSLGSGRVAYAGKQIGTTFALVFTGLSPALDIYTPLWRIWAILLGTLVVAFVAFMLWPEYAGDSLLPRLRKVIRDTLSLVPGGSGANTKTEIQQAIYGTMRELGEILEVADDAQVEGRTSTVNHSAIVEASSRLRRIANRLASISTLRIVTPVPPLDPTTESAREAVLDATRRHLQSWLDFFGGEDSLNASAAQATAQSNSTGDMKVPLEQFSSRLEESKFARIDTWTIDQRRTILAELHSMRRLEELVSDLNQWLAQIPGSSSNAVPPTVRRSTGLWQRTTPP
jgi:fusaric acid resistance family protein